MRVLLKMGENTFQLKTVFGLSLSFCLPVLCPRVFELQLAFLGLKNENLNHFTKYFRLNCVSGWLKTSMQKGVGFGGRRGPAIVLAMSGVHVKQRKTQVN